MPIRPENKNRYPANWKEIRASILARSGNCCEWCGVLNHAEGARDIHGEWHDERQIDNMNSTVGEILFGEYPKIIRIVLTIAHIDHTPEHNDPANLAALCQRCHLNHDRHIHLANRAETVKRKRAERREAARTANGQKVFA